MTKPLKGFMGSMGKLEKSFRGLRLKGLRCIIVLGLAQWLTHMDDDLNERGGERNFLKVSPIEILAVYPIHTTYVGR